MLSWRQVASPNLRSLREPERERDLAACCTTDGLPFDGWIQARSATPDRKNSAGGLKVQDVPRPMIKPPLHRLHLLAQPCIEVRALREEPPHQPGRILARATLLSGGGRAEVRPCPQHLIDPQMFNVLAPVVVGERASDRAREAGERPIQAGPHRRRRAPQQAVEGGIPALPVNRELQHGLPLPGHHRVGLPVTELPPRIGRGRLLGDGHPRQNMGLGVAPRIAARGRRR